MVVKIAIFGLIVLLAVGMTIPSFAHTSVNVEQYEIEAGWGIEPPVVGIRNDLVFKITEPGDTKGTHKGVTSVFKDVHTTVLFGGASKKLDINSDPRPGYYFSPIIPTKIGSYMIEFKGEISGVIIDVKIPVEDVEPTAVLDFPPSASGGNTDVSALKNAMSSLQQDVSKLKSGETTVALDGSVSYDFAILGLAIASAAIILAIISLVKRK